MTTRLFSVDDRWFEVTGLGEHDAYLRGIAGEFEPGFQAFCRNFLDRDAVALDIGANIGATAIILSQYLPQGRIFALEPGKTIFRLLEQNLERNGIQNVTALNYAIADRTRTLSFVEASAYGHILPDAPVVEEHAVAGYALDDLVEELRLERLDFIKVDVEGFEPQFFQGAQKTLARFKPTIYFEFNSWCLIAHSGSNPMEFMRQICRDFQLVYRVSKDPVSKIILEKISSQAKAESFVHDNIVYHGSVDDIVVSNDSARFTPAALKLTDLYKDGQDDGLHASTFAQVRALRAERDSLQQQLELIQRSRSWRYTRLLRRQT